MSTKAALCRSGVLCLVLIFIAFISRMLSSYPNDAYTTTVESAVLTVLNPTTSPSTSTLRYNLAVNISFRIDHDSMMCHDFITTAFYKDSMLGVPENWIPTDSDGDWVQETGWSSSFQGTVVVYPSVATELERERAEGTVHVRVRVSASATVLSSQPRSHYIFDDLSMFDCWLWFPPPGDGAPAIFGEGTECWPAK